VNWNARAAFWVTTAFQLVAGLFDLMNTTRFNQTLLGWTGLANVQVDIRESLFDPSAGYRTVRADDLASFLFGSYFLEPLIDQLDQLPSTLLLSKLCPKGIETTMFALLAGYSNIGMSLSGQMGGLAIGFFEFNFRKGNAAEGIPSTCNMGGPEPGNPESFHGLARCLVLGNLLLPFLTIPLTFCFIPNQTLNSDFLQEVEEPREVQMIDIEQAEGQGGEARTRARTGSNASVDRVLLRTAVSNNNMSGSIIM